MKKEFGIEMAKTAVALSAAYAGWKEYGDEFKFTDDLNGYGIGPIRSIGRLGIKFTVSVLCYILTDAAITQTVNAFKKNVEVNCEDTKEAEDTTDINEETDTVEEDE